MTSQRHYEMRIVSLINEAAMEIIERILRHVGSWGLRPVGE